MARALPRVQRAILVAAAAAAALGLLAATPAAADESSKLYGGAGLVVADFGSDHDGIAYDDTPVGWQAYGGWQASQSVAVELAIDRLAGIDSDDLLGSGVERLRISADYSSLTLRGVFSVSLEEVLRGRPKITVFATIGAARSLEERTVVELTTARAASVAERDTALALGAGVTFELKGVRLRTSLQSVDRADGALNSVGVAAEFRF